MVTGNVPAVDIELRHLRAFVAVAEELNFTRAAQRLFIAQQGLSAQIRQLEDRIGTRLFDRDTRRVALTPAGAALYQQAKALLDDAEAAIAAAQAVGSGASRTLRVGFVVSIEHRSFAHVLNEFAVRHPGTEVRIRFGEATDPSGGLRTGAVDVAFVYGPFETRGLATTHLFTEPLGVVMAVDHPLASAPDVDLADVLAQPTFDFPTEDTAWRDYWMATVFRRGIEPTIVADFRSLDALVEAIRAGLGVHTGTRSLAELGGPSLVWRELPDLPPLEHSVAWVATDRRPEVAEFVAVAAEVFGR